MAVSLSNHYVLAPRRPSAPFGSSKPSSPSKALAFARTSLSLTHPRRHTQQAHFLKPILGFPRVASYAISESKSSRFVSPFAASSVDDERQSSQSEAALESGADRRDVFNLKTLIRVYREAILVGDIKAVADIEARIAVIGNDTNELVEKVTTLTAEVESGREKYIRLQADFDNFRKRSEKDRLSIRSNAQGELIESLLPMVDNFERAKQQLKPETEMEKKIDASYQGIYKQFVEIMRSLRVAAVPTVGKPFDPLLHEAIAREESHEFNEGIVIQEFRRGFLLGDRLLRPAMVKVSSGPGRKAGATATTAAAAGVDE